MRRNITNGILIVSSITNFACGGGGDDGLDVEITSPTTTAYTNASVTVQVLVSGGVADRLELLRDGVPMVTLEMPYQYTWDTTGEDEGEHEVVARAFRGEAEFDSPPRFVVVDRTAPTIASRTPATGDLDVWVHEPLRVTFSEPIHPDSVVDAAVTVTTDAGLVGSTPSLSVDGLTLTITSETTLSAPDTAVVTIGTDFTDLAGNHLAPDGDLWTFSLPEWVHMGEPLDLLPDADTDSRDPIVRLGAGGDPVVAWAEEAPGGAGRSIQLASWDGDAWAPFAEMNAVPAADLSLAVDPAGTPVLAWGRYNVTDTFVRVEHWDGAAWTQLGADLDAWTSYPAESPAVTVDSSGATIVAWSEYSSTSDQRNLYVRRWNGDAWDSIGPSVSQNTLAGTDAILPELVLGPSDRLVLAWAEKIQGEFDLFVAEWNAGTSSWVLLGGALDEVAAAGVRDPALVFDGNTPIVAWSEGDSIFVKRWTGSSWQGLPPLGDADPIMIPRGPSLALDTDGSLLVAWNEWHTTASRVQITRFDSDQWQPVGSGTVRFWGTSYVESPSLTVAPTGEMYLGLNDRSGTPEVHVLLFNR